ncbi:Atu2307/SP_0267 family LLM class monooxygenase [Paraburkholderia pallida]|uniref:LLM class flavin-dependent oxidoreductase n=1 Tax=Paraburkholderia pallida TaxID=2547399 RepID=A0A4V1B062_9BURK|nr:Atu2307/SP_0267 family LLM class monooxygenase [Paraburkholderia pallida]QBR01663.1 LLM class flavin-dependent oxidoreductase [Paraburkholderia pallida]
MEIGIDSFAAIFPEAGGERQPSPADRMEALIEEVEAADRVGLDIFGIGEHHRKEFLDAAPAVILAAAAARTRNIRLASAVTVLGASDPVRVFQEFATIDLISRGRAEITVGRGSFVEAYPLFGFQLEDYDALFGEKLELLLKLQESTHVKWTGRFRPALDGVGVFPRPHQPRLPIWMGAGGTPQSFVRAGMLGLPLMVAVIGGDFRRFRPLIDLYRQAGIQAGHSPAALKVGIHAIGFVGETTEAAKNAFFPGWSYMFTELGRERGWPPTTRAQFEAMCGRNGPLLVGDPETVAAKVLHASHALGGISRLTFQMSSASLESESMLRSIELLGTEVAPIIRRSANRGTRHG